MPNSQEILLRFKNKKTLPHVAIRLSRLMSEENCTVKQIEEVIRLDPTMVLRLLKLVNSPYYGLLQKVESISNAVVYIGLKNLRNMIVLEAMKDIFEESESVDIFSRSRLWLHCAAVSICSQMISERIFQINSEDAFLCGILHDIGMIVEDQVVGDLFLQSIKAWKPKTKAITEYEREIIGTDHSQVGYHLAKDWKLPPAVQEGIRLHHKTGQEVSPSSISGIVQISEMIVSRLDYTAFPQMSNMPAPNLLTHVQENMNEYKALIRDLPGAMENAKALYEREGAR